MADIKAIREALAANLSSLLPDAQVSAYALADPTPPTVMIDGPSADYHGAMGNGLEVWTFTVLVLVSDVSDVGSQQRLDRMIDSSGDESVKALLESNTLGGIVEDVTVRSSTGPKTYSLDTVGGSQRPPYLGAEFVVEVMTDSS